MELKVAQKYSAREGPDITIYTSTDFLNSNVHMKRCYVTKLAAYVSVPSVHMARKLTSPKIIAISFLV